MTRLLNMDAGIMVICQQAGPSAAPFRRCLRGTQSVQPIEMVPDVVRARSRVLLQSNTMCDRHIEAGLPGAVRSAWLCALHASRLERRL